MANARRYGPSRKVEAYPKLDVRRWPRPLRLGPPLPATEQTIVVPLGGGQHTVTVVWEQCGGGWRRWFRCSGCHSRRATLYLVRGVLRCRVCHGLRYHTQTVTPAERTRLRFVKWRERQGLSGALTAPFRPRRKNEHHAHYLDQFVRDSLLQLRANEAWLEGVRRYLRR